MKYEDIIKLLDAGYSREEIIQMKEEPAADPEPTSADPEPTPADPEPTPAENAILNEFKGLFADLKKELTAMNIMNSRMDEDAKTGEDVIASIINPPKYNKKEGK